MCPKSEFTDYYSVWSLRECEDGTDFKHSQSKAGQEVQHMQRKQATL